MKKLFCIALFVFALLTLATNFWQRSNAAVLVDYYTGQPKEYRGGCSSAPAEAPPTTQAPKPNEPIDDRPQKPGE